MTALMNDPLKRLRTAFPWPEFPPAVRPNFGPAWFSDDDRRGHARLFRMLVPIDVTLIVELGSFVGRSAAGWLRLFPHAHVVAVDTWNGSVEHREDARFDAILPRLMETFLANLWHERARVTPLRMTTGEGLRVLHAFGLKPDVIYIDADHATEAVAADVSRSLDLFPDALVMGDDWNWPSVRLGVETVASKRGLPLAACDPVWWFANRHRGHPRAQCAAPGCQTASDKVVTATLFRRAKYARSMLEALARCDGIDEYRVLLHLEPGFPDVLDVAQSIPFRHKVMVENVDLLGCSANTRAALDHGFQYSDFVVHLEDDTVPARDCLRYFEWARQIYRTDRSVFTVTSYSRDVLPAERAFEVVRHPWFTPWGWGTWHDRWTELRDRWNFDQDVTWDICINKMREGRFEVRPLLARTQNIGAEQGAHCPSPEFHRLHHFNPFGAWSIACPSDGVFREVSVG